MSRARHDSAALQIGVRVVIRDAMTLDDVGECHAPGPVKPDDLIALADGHPYRVIALLPAEGDADIVAVLARPAKAKPASQAEPA